MHSRVFLSTRPTLTALAITAFCLTANAQPRQDERRGPPAEALTACQSLAAGDACSFNGRRGKVSGSCEAPDNKPLACRPAGAPGPEGGNPRGKQ